MERENTPDSRKDRIYDPSEWESMLDTDTDSDIEKIKRSKSFKDRLDPLLCKSCLLFYARKFILFLHIVLLSFLLATSKRIHRISEIFLIKLHKRMG